MPAERPAEAAYRKAAFYLQLTSTGKRAGERFSVRLEPELLTLLDPDDHTVLSVHREEAARYIRFSYDLFRGRVVSFVIVEGVKIHSFRIDRDQIGKLLSWLPHVGKEETQKELRYAGLTVALIGLLHLLVYQYVKWGWPWGVCLLAVGFAGFLFPRRPMYGVNAVVLLAVGLWDLALRPSAVWEEQGVSQLGFLIPVAIGVVLILWSVQQASMLSVNQFFRSARAVRDARVSFLPRESPLVRNIGRLNIAASVVAGIYVLLLLLTLPFRQASGELSGFADVSADTVVFAVLTVLCPACAFVFLRRKTPSYVEAKASLLVLAAIAALFLWAFFFGLHQGKPLYFFGRIFGENVNFAKRHYVITSLLIVVLILNRVASHWIEREIEEQRG